MCFEWKQIEMLKSDYETNDNAWWQCWSEKSDPCCNSRKCEGYFGQMKMISWNYTSAVFLTWIHFWKDSSNLNFSLHLHHFYSFFRRSLAQLSSYHSWVKFLQEYIFSQVIYNEAAKLYHVPFIAFWRPLMYSPIQ